MWDRIKRTDKPVVLYGTGNAAERILNELDVRGIRASGIFASDGFVRDRYFRGFKVLSYAEAKETFGDMLVLLAFGSHLPSVTAQIEKIASEQELLAPDLPVAGYLREGSDAPLGELLFDREYYDTHRAELDETRALLADEQSRLVFDNVIEYRLSGRIDPLLACHTPEKEIWDLLVNWPDDLHGCKKRGGLSLLDLGAYTGDTAQLFIDACGGECSRIICVEPDPRNFRKLSEFAARERRIEPVNAAAGAFCGTVRFAKGSGRGALRRASGSKATSAAPGGRIIEVRQTTADLLLSGSPVDFIKMDLEGTEAEAIRGAEHTIRTFRPRMLISAYHRREDLFAIPREILSIRRDYSLYLRKAPCIPGWDFSFVFI